MGLEVERTTIREPLTRTSGYLKTVTSHSLQPYRGCTFGRSLCGVGCYVRHNPWLGRGRAWGEFLEARENCAAAYLASVARERRWARRARGDFSIFLSSSTDPFLPQERRFGITRAVLRAMLDEPPDALVVQTHSPRVLDALDVLVELGRRTALRVHVSVETDRVRIPGLPPPTSTPAARLGAVRTLRDAGLFTVVTVAPLMPIEDPHRFFADIAVAADAVVIDHFIGGDGSVDGARTRATALPAAMARLDPGANALGHRDRMVEVARRFLPGRVGVGVDGFAGRWLAAGGG